MSKVTIFNHPLIHHKLSIIRDENTNTKDFRQSVNEIANLMAFEATRNLPLKEVKTKTPISLATTYMLDCEVVIVPILRAGIGMVDGIHSLIPTAKVGHIGLYRNEETLEPQLYYAKFPPTLPNAIVFLVDPMLATGGSAVAAIDVLKANGAKSIKLVNLVAAPEGIAEVQKYHNDVDIYVASIDERLNDHGYIVPGLGDAGDRLFCTK